MIRNKKGGFADLFLLIVFSLIIVIFIVVMIYASNKTTQELHTKLDGTKYGNINANETIDNTMGRVNASYGGLNWIAFLIIIAMIISIFIGSSLVTTKPMYFIPYIFIVIIAIFVSIGVSNAYETMAKNSELQSTFVKMTMPNLFLAYLPLWVTIIGFIGGIIVYSRMGSGGQTQYYA